MLGQDINLPTGYKGLVVQETKQPLVENVDRTLHASHVFDKLTYWNWDKMPSANDPFISALDWIDIAEAVSDLTVTYLPPLCHGLVYLSELIVLFQIHAPVDSSEVECSKI